MQANENVMYRSVV